MKISKKDRIYIFFIVLLTILFVGMFYIAISGWLYKDDALSKMHLKLGASSVIEVKGSQAQALSYNFDGAWLGGQIFKQNISVRNTGDEDVYLRAKLIIFSEENNDPKLSLVANDNWFLAEDGYLYAVESVGSLATIGLTSGLQISEENQLTSKTNYIITLQVESISTKLDRKSVWGN